MIVKQIKLSSSSKEKLSRLKAKTGIKNWNILCRWALCLSLKKGTIPADVPISSDSNVEMSWYTFAGEYSDLFDALIIEWCSQAGVGTDHKTLAKYFKLHLERGIGYLSGTGYIKNICDLVAIAAGERE